MIELVVLVFMMQSVVLLILYKTDSEMKFLSQRGIKQYEQLPLKRGKYLFMFSKRKESIITKYAFVCMIIFYIVNGAGFAVLLVQYIAKNDPLITLYCMILGFANIGLVIIVGSPPGLTKAQEEESFYYLQKQHEEYLKKGEIKG